MVLFLLYFNVRLYDRPCCVELPGGRLDDETHKQLHFLYRALRENHAAEAMQDHYPEGFVFTHALSALAWCEVAEDLPSESNSRQEGLRDIAYSIEQLYSAKARATFDRELPLPYGAFYRGWTAYVQGRYLQLLPPEQRDSTQIARFRADCGTVARTISDLREPYLESYRNSAWPADNVLCLAALALHDRLFQPDFQAVRTHWLAQIQSTLDPEYQLIPHDYNLTEQRSSEGVRGSSQTLMLCFLPAIDSAFAAQQYRNFRRVFAAWRLGLPGICEYPAGRRGRGDVDSGPVLLGMGGAASVVGVRASAENGDWALCLPMRQAVKALLLPRKSEEEHCYLFGKLPVLDAFMAWSNAGLACREPGGQAFWPWKFQLFSLLFAGLAGLLFWKWRSGQRKVLA